MSKSKQHFLIMFGVGLTATAVAVTTIYLPSQIKPKDNLKDSDKVTKYKSSMWKNIDNEIKSQKSIVKGNQDNT